MSRSMRWARWVSAVGVGAAVLVLATPQAAVAATTLTDGTIASHTGTHSIWYDEFDFETTAETWSAVAIYAPTRWRGTLLSTGSPWRVEASTGTTPYGTTQFIAIDSHRRALGTYRLQVTRDTGPDVYVQWRQANTEIVLPVPANDGVSGPGDPDIAFAVKNSSDVIAVYNLYLEAGEAFWVNSLPGDSFFLLESNEHNPYTEIVTRTQAVVPGTYTVGNCTLYTANHSGMHGIVVVSNDPPTTTVPGSGIAFVLHRFDPARPFTCPQRNFPHPTPPGP